MRRTQICPLVFADVVGSSKVPDQLKSDLLDRNRKLLAQISGSFQVIHSKLVGDGLFICGADVAEMAEAALMVRDAYQNADWTRRGYPDQVTIRVGVDLQKVQLVEGDVVGQGVDLASRIQPIVRPNEVWCTDAFAGQLEREKIGNIASRPLGRKQLDKGAGTAELHQLLWSKEIGRVAIGTTEVGTKVPTKLKRKLTDADLDDFAVASFDEIMRQFRQRGEELTGDRGGGVTFRLESITRHKFKFSLYADGEQKAQCRVWLADDDREIRISFGRGRESDSSYNEALTAKSDGAQAFLEPMGMALMAVANERLTAIQAAEHLWEHLTR